MITIRRIIFFTSLALVLNGYGQDNLKIRTNNSGDIIAFGTFSGILDFGNGTVLGLISSEDEGYFLASFDSTGILNWVKHLKGESQRCSGMCPGIGLAIDFNNNILITGNYWDHIEFDSVNTLSNTGRAESFVAKYDKDGNFTWMLHGSSPGISRGVEIDTDSKGNIYASGYFSGEGPFTLDSTIFLPAEESLESIYVTRITSTGIVEWMQRIYGPGPDSRAGVHVQSHATDSSGNCYLTGYYGGSNGVNISFGEHVLTYYGEDMEIFIAKCGSDGEPLWMINAPSASGFDMPDQIAVNDNGNLFITGMIKETVQFGALPPLNPNYIMDLFIAKYDTSGQANWVTLGMPEPGFVNAVGTGITVSNTGKVFSVGAFSDSLLFPPLPLISSDSGFGFLVKHDSMGVALSVSNHDLRFQDIVFGSDRYLYTISGNAAALIHESEVTITKWDLDCNRIWDRVIHSSIYLGKEESQPSPDITIFPNPTSNVVSVRFDTPPRNFTSIAVYNINGQVVLSDQIEPGNQIYRVDVSELVGSVFILKVETDKESFTRKIIKLD
ncbi:MAG: T9SS type A sorting domain-containing protein [Bacteroidota bacterium]